MKKANIFKTTLLYGALGLAGILSSFGGLASTSNVNDKTPPQQKEKILERVAEEGQRNADAMTTCIHINNALQQYARDNENNPTGKYPPDLQTLIDEGYMHEWPKNPYAKGNPGVFLRMHQIDLGNFMPGGIIYHPYKHPLTSSDGLSAYYLGVYGAAPKPPISLFGPKLFVPKEFKDIPGGLLILVSTTPTSSSNPNPLYLGVK